ncbi:MAG: hypothetical protein AAFQ82_23780, partial [Myxococcota bacterium]
RDPLTELVGPLNARAPRPLLFQPRNHAHLPYESPFKGVNAHYFQVTGSHALSEYLRRNGASNLSELWTAHRASELVRPNLEQVTRRIFANGAHLLASDDPSPFTARPVGE